MHFYTTTKTSALELIFADMLVEFILLSKSAKEITRQMSMKIIDITTANIE